MDDKGRRQCSGAPVEDDMIESCKITIPNNRDMTVARNQVLAMFENKERAYKRILEGQPYLLVHFCVNMQTQQWCLVVDVDHMCEQTHILFSVLIAHDEDIVIWADRLMAIMAGKFSPRRWFIRRNVKRHYNLVDLWRNIKGKWCLKPGYARHRKRPEDISDNLFEVNGKKFNRKSKEDMDSIHMVTDDSALDTLMRLEKEIDDLDAKLFKMRREYHEMCLGVFTTGASVSSDDLLSVVAPKEA